MMDETTFFLRIAWKRNEQRNEEGRKERRKEGKKQRRNETRRYPPFLQRNSVFFLFQFLYISLSFITFEFDVKLNYLILGLFSSCDLFCLALFYFSFR